MCHIILSGDLMNIFETLFLNLVLILFPLLIYIIFLSANKNIDKNTKGGIFSFLLLASLFFVYKYQVDEYAIISFLMANSLILIAYLKNKIFTANLLVFFLLIFFNISFNNIIFFLIPYLFLSLIYLLRKKINFNDFLFIDLFLGFYFLIFSIWLITYNSNLYLDLGIIDTILIYIFTYIIIHIIYFLYKIGEDTVNYNVNYKNLKHDEQIKLSLFKITHEIKNPIAVIKAYLDMLNVKDKKQVEKYIPIIKNEINRLLNLLQDFLLVNKANVAFDLMDINLLIEEVLKQELPIIESKKIKLISKLIDDEVYISGDYNRLSQVIINIIKNSIEAMDGRDNKVIKIKNNIKDDQLNIIIEDNGIGISKKNLKKIKEPFYTTKVRGTGLGVSLSDEIISAHNGVLDYESVLDKGTKVVIKLPLYRKDNYA